MYGTRHCSQFTDVFLLTGCFIFLCASGSSLTVTVHQTEVNGTVKQSVLLPLRYSTSTNYSILRLYWSLFPRNTPFVKLTRSNCSPDPDGSGYNCSDRLMITPSYRDRIHLHPENGSLLLWNVQSNDSGIYVFSVYDDDAGAIRKGNVTLTVYNRTASGSSLTVTVHQTEVNGTVNQSVLLPLRYSTSTIYSILRLYWSLFPRNTPFVKLTRSNCSPDPDGSGYNCSDWLVITPSYRDRVHLYPENGSLLLWNVQSNDSGVYVFSVYEDDVGTTRTGNVTLTVYNRIDSVTSSPTHTSPTTDMNKVKNIGVPAATAAVSLLVILICLYLVQTRKHTGCQQQQDSALMETSVQPIENEGSLSNSNDLTYTVIQWPGSSPHPHTQTRPQEIIYALAQRTDSI